MATFVPRKTRKWFGKSPVLWIIERLRNVKRTKGGPDVAEKVYKTEWRECTDVEKNLVFIERSETQILWMNELFCWICFSLSSGIFFLWRWRGEFFSGRCLLIVTGSTLMEWQMSAAGSTDRHHHHHPLPGVEENKERRQIFSAFGRKQKAWSLVFEELEKQDMWWLVRTCIGVKTAHFLVCCHSFCFVFLLAQF